MTIPDLLVAEKCLCAGREWEEGNMATGVCEKDQKTARSTGCRVPERNCTSMLTIGLEKLEGFGTPLPVLRERKHMLQAYAVLEIRKQGSEAKSTHSAEKKQQVLHGFIKARDLFPQAVVRVLNNHERSML